MMKSIHVGAALLAAVFALSAHGAETPLAKKDGVLVSAAGMTVYTFDKDAANSGKSACSGPCATNWPALSAGDATVGAPYSVITREDGSKQLAYKGKPLYLYGADKQPGEHKGDNFKGMWHTVKD